MTDSTPPDNLATLLGDLRRAGVRPLPIGSAERLRAAAEHNAYVARSVDLATCRSKADLLDRLAAALAFPEWFGHNWDALADCLGDLSWLPAPGYVLLLEHAAGLRAHDPDTLDNALEILREASEAWAAEQVPFWVFLDLSNPSSEPATA